MAIALTTAALRRTLRDKELVLKAQPSGNYAAKVAHNIATGEFTQAAAGAPLLYTFTSLAALAVSVTFSTSGALGAGTQAVTLSTYTGITSTSQATAQAAANLLAAALTAGSLGTASGASYSAIVTQPTTGNQGTLAIYTNKAAEVLSVSASTATSTTIGGDTVDLTSITIPVGFPSDGNVGYPGQINQYEVIKFAAGYTAQLIPGPNLTAWLLQVFSAAGTQQATGAYPAALLADFFELRLIGPKLRM